jgi:drug/metabolite transporter (DMT)-like permease
VTTQTDAHTTPQAVPNPLISRRNLIILALISLYLVWGSTYLGLRVGLESFPPFLLGSIRYAFSTLILFAFLFATRKPMPALAQARNAMIVGALTLGVGTGGVAFAQQWVSSGLASVAVAAVPLWTAMFAVFFMKRPSKMEWVGLVIGFSGIILLNLGSDIRAQPLGMIALIIAPLSWSFGSILSRKLSLPDGMTAIAFECLGACVLFAVVAVLRQEPLVSDPPTLRSWFALVYLAIFGSLVGYTAYMYLLKTVRPTVATSYAYVNPLVAVFLGVVLAGETLTLVGIMAMVIILTGVIIVMTARDTQAKSSQTSA